MANVSNYYIESRTKLISNKESCIIGNKYHINTKISQIRVYTKW